MPTPPAVSARRSAAPFPALSEGPADRIWNDYFATQHPSPRSVAAKVQALHEAGEHAHVIGLIQAALIHGQSQPWMYEVLALSMEIEKSPREEIERVVLSLADFGTADFGTMSYSAAYLVRLGRDAAGLRLYREASRMLPEQPEPYVLGLRLARKLKDVDAVEWGATGVLQHLALLEEEPDRVLALERALILDALLDRKDGALEVAVGVLLVRGVDVRRAARRERDHRRGGQS